ncbi:MAG: glucan biosynthesis protein [Rhodobacteraceae bacterium]|nr:glucan biosynthesis protein [Paracoccaceae bacterium]
MRRRSLLQGAAALALGTLPGGPLRADPSGLSTPESIVAAARARARAPYAPADAALVPPFDALTYDSHRAIRPRPGGAAQIPLGGPFRADLLPPGWLFADPVAVQLPGQGAPVPFDPAHFTYDPRYFPDGAPESADPAMGFSGLRLTAPFNTPDRRDELAVFQGASYFRALAHGAAYGLSARGLALGTGGAGPEEFPVTRHITIFGADEAGVHMGCLIDSPRAAAALILRIAPGRAGAPDTVMDCALHLFPRDTITDAGIAPLTSMFQHADLGPGFIDDFRPAVHDSDVLVMDNGAGERLWRPLTNPARVELAAFADENPRRFGLLQSPDAFERFRDAEGAYHRRPSAMVEPLGDWGAGAVMLLEIPTIDEYADNIVAFWRPADPLQPGQEHRFAYRLRWQPAGLDALPAGAQALPLLPVRSASGVEPVTRAGRLFVIDFAPGPGAVMPDADALTLDFGALAGAGIEGAALYPLDEGTLRASFVLVPESATDVAELRLRLRHRAGGALAAPVWMLRWTRARGGGI